MLTGKTLKFNGFRLDSLLAIEEVRRSMLPPISVASTAVPGLSGEIPLVSRLGTRKIEVDVRAFATTEAALWELIREVAAKLYTTAPAELIIDGETTSCMAMLTGGTDLDQFFNNAGTTLIFTSFDGLLYGAEVAKSISNRAIVANNGTYKSEMTAEITLASAATELTLTNITTGEFVKVSGLSMAKGGKLIITCGDHDRTVKYNGIVVMDKVDLNSGFWQLQPGDNDISCSTGSCVIKWRPRYL